MRGQIDELRELTAETLEAVRKLAVELRPATLDDLGLVAALEAYTEAYAARMPAAASTSAPRDSTIAMAACRRRSSWCCIAWSRRR